MLFSDQSSIAASKETNNIFKDEKVNANTVIRTAAMSSISSFASEIEVLCTSPISQSYHDGSTKTSERESNRELSGMLSSIVLENWSFALRSTPKVTIESILGEDSAGCSTNEAEKKDIILKSSSHFQDIVAQKSIIGSIAATESRKKEPVKLAQKDPFYEWVIPDDRILSQGLVAVSEAPMASEYDELWKETHELIQSENFRLRL